MRFLSSALLITLLLFLTGCNAIPGENSGGILNKKRVLKLNPDAQYFEFDNCIYVTGMQWIEEEKLTKGDVIGEITEGMSNHLPIGAKIISTLERSDILIVEYDEIENRYLLQVGE